MGEEQKMILKMIEDGKITAEEGLALLKQLEKSTEKQLPSTEVKENKKEETEYEGTYSQPSFTDRFVEFIDTAVKKVKDFSRILPSYSLQFVPRTITLCTKNYTIWYRKLYPSVLFWYLRR